MNRIFSALIWLNACSLVSSQSSHEEKEVIDCMKIQNANERINCLYTAEAFSDERHLRSRILPVLPGELEYEAVSFDCLTCLHSH